MVLKGFAHAAYPMDTIIFNHARIIYMQWTYENNRRSLVLSTWEQETKEVERECARGEIMERDGGKCGEE